MSSGLLPAMVLVPLTAGFAAVTLGRRSPALFARLGASAAGLGFLVAVALGVQIARGEVPAAAAGQTLQLGADQVAVVLLMLVFGVSAVVQSFAVRYLAGDARATWFTGGAGLLTAASAGLMTAGTLVGLAIFWTLAGVALCLLLGMYWELPAARDGVRRTATSFLIGDGALWIGVALATATWGQIELRSVQPGQLEGPALPVVACLIVVAALARSAQIPFHRWLPATLSAPTPVSALLHAGVVNAGGILLIRTAPLVTGDLARLLIIVAGASTMAYGAVIMLVKPDIKGALVNSTTAQMGFMILTCGLGLWAAALIHLVAHGFYKSTLFMSSGSAIAAHRRSRELPPPTRDSRAGRILRGATALGISAGALAAALAVAPVLVPQYAGDHAAEQVLMIFALVTGAAAMWGWLGRRPGVGGAALGAAFLVPAAVAYVALVDALSNYLLPALPAPTLSTTAVWLIAAAALALLGVLAVARSAPGADRLRHALYAQALSAGHLPIRPTMTPTGARS